MDGKTMEQAGLLIEEGEDKTDVFSIGPNFGVMLKHYRKRVKGLSLKELEELSGVSSGYIHRLESGTRKSPSITKVLQLAESLQIKNSLLVATIMNRSSESEIDDTLSDVLIKNDFLVNSLKLNGDAKELVIRIMEHIAEADWQPNTKIRELYELSELIDQLKEAI